MGSAGHQHGELGREHRGWETGHGAEAMGGSGLGTGDEPVPLFQYHLLPQHYQFLLVAAFIILSLAEGSRLYLGYVGNLQEKVGAVSLPQHLVRDSLAGGIAATLHVAMLETRVLVPAHSSWSCPGGNRGCRQDMEAADKGVPLALLLYPSLCSNAQPRPVAGMFLLPGC